MTDNQNNKVIRNIKIAIAALQGANHEDLKKRFDLKSNESITRSIKQGLGNVGVQLHGKSYKTLRDKIYIIDKLKEKLLLIQKLQKEYGWIEL